MPENYWTKTTRGMLGSVNEVGAKPFILFQYYLTYKSASEGIKPSLNITAKDLGIKKTAVCNLKKILINKEWIKEENGEIIILKTFRKNESDSENLNTDSEKMNEGSENLNESFRKNESPYIRNEKEDLERNKTVSNETGDKSPSGDSPLSATVETTVGRRIWTDGVELLKNNGKSESQIRSLLGKLAQEYGNDLLAQCIAITQAKNPASPHEFLIASLKFQKKLIAGTNASQPVYSWNDLEKAEADFIAELKNGANANV